MDKLDYRVHTLLDALYFSTQTPVEEEKLRVLQVILHLFLHGKREDLEMALRLHFPEYFTGYKPFTVK